MRYKIITGFLVLALVISLGFNVFNFQLQTQNAVLLNNMRSRAVLVWSSEMYLTGLLIENATTNYDMGRVFLLAESVTRTGGIFYEVIDYSPNSLHYLYWQMIETPQNMSDNLFAYAVGYPHNLKYINPTAFAMFKNLTEAIYDITSLLVPSSIDDHSGVDPAEQLIKHVSLVDMYTYFIKIQILSRELADFNPKFQ